MCCDHSLTQSQVCVCLGCVWLPFVFQTPTSSLCVCVCVVGHTLTRVILTDTPIRFCRLALWSPVAFSIFHHTLDFSSYYLITEQRVNRTVCPHQSYPTHTTLLHFFIITSKFLCIPVISFAEFACGNAWACVAPNG